MPIFSVSDRMREFDLVARVLDYDERKKIGGAESFPN
jgi:hypothetical protein